MRRIYRGYRFPPDRCICRERELLCGSFPSSVLLYPAGHGGQTSAQAHRTCSRHRRGRIGARSDVGFFAFLHKQENVDSRRSWQALTHRPHRIHRPGSWTKRGLAVLRQRVLIAFSRAVLRLSDVLLHRLQLAVEILGAYRALWRMTDSMSSMRDGASGPPEAFLSSPSFPLRGCRTRSG